MKRSHRLIFLVLLVVGLMVPAQAVIADGSGTLGYHIVYPGETLYCIGRAYGVDPWAIAAYNDIAIAQVNYIHPGRVLSIPENAFKYIPPGPTCIPQFDIGPGPNPPEAQCGGCTCRVMHTVTTGDTLLSIAALYGVDMWSIAKCSCIYNLNYIRIADPLCIPE